MAKARTIVKRRKAVENIRKITRTMQLIATARFQAAFNRAVASKPYTERITQLVEQLSRGQADLNHPLLEVNTASKKSVLIVITSNRGLCGGYNSSLLRGAVEHLQSRQEAGESVDLHAVGKKGIAYFRFMRHPIARTDARFEDKPQFAMIEPIAAELIDAYERKQIDSVYVTYMKFVSVGVQRVTTMPLLPIQRPGVNNGVSQGAVLPHTPSVQYEFTPPAEELLAELLPETVKVRLFQCFMDAAVSEQVSRMVAMKSATDAAGDMIRALTRQYNRARQTQITMELLDIVGGANAIS